MKTVAFVALLLAPAAGLAAEVYRCSGPSGIAYQEFPCADGVREAKLELPQSFPEVNGPARDQLMAREAALDARLEAERERLSREEIARKQAAAQVAAAQAYAATPAEPVYYAAWPYARPYAARPARPMPRNPSNPWAPR